jgi:hypothetical protein
MGRGLDGILYLVHWFSGGYSEGETPLPFPNRAVKPLCADGTWLERAWESRSPPVFYLDSEPSDIAFVRRLESFKLMPCSQSDAPFSSNRVSVTTNGHVSIIAAKVNAISSLVGRPMLEAQSATTPAMATSTPAGATRENGPGSSSPNEKTTAPRTAALIPTMPAGLAAVRRECV